MDPVEEKLESKDDLEFRGVTTVQKKSLKKKPG